MNKRGASLLLCFTLVANMVACSFSKDTFVSFKPNINDSRQVSEETVNLTEALKDYFESTNDLGLQNDMGLSEEKYQELLDKNFYACTEEKSSESYTSEEIFNQIKQNTSNFVLENADYNDFFSDYSYNQLATEYGWKIKKKTYLKLKIK